MAKVFVSHASEDLALALQVGDWLRELRHGVFLDHDEHDGFEPGDRWRERLFQELRAADAVLCIVTTAFSASPWCAAEIGAAYALGSRLLPLRVDPRVALPLLEDRQYVEYDDRDKWKDALAAALRTVDAVGGLGWAEGQSPFPGLRPFDVGMARFFRGRAAEVRELASLVRRPKDRPGRGGVLVVVGSSGCGKSSLVRAGLLARLAHEPGWVVVAPFEPGDDPVDELATWLTNAAVQAGLKSTLPETRERLRQPDGLVDVAAELLLKACGPDRRGLLLVVDQGEQLFTRSDPQARRDFMSLLGRAAAGPVQTVMTLRSEYLDQLAGPELDGALEAFVLAPLTREKLRVVVEDPARTAGLTVDPELVDRLVADTGSGDALPLLAFALNQLADGVGPGGSLSMDKYDRLGGVRRALTKHADDALVQAAADSKLTVDGVLAALVQLVHLDETGRRAGRQVALADLSCQEQQALNAFVAKRLLMTSGDKGESLHVAHEALLTEWMPLDAAISERAERLPAVRSLEQAASEWQAHDRSDHFLWEADRLRATVTALGLGSRTADDFTTSLHPTGIQLHPTDIPLHSTDIPLRPDAKEFLAATRRRVDVTRRRRRRSRNRVVAVLSVLLVLALSAAGIAASQRTSAVDARHLAEQQRVVEASRKFTQEALVLRDRKPRVALALSVLAYDLAPELPEARDSLLSAQAGYYDAVLRPGLGPVHAVAVSPDNQLLASAQHDNAVSLWKMPDRTELAVLATTAPVYDLAFSGDGKMLATAGQDGMVTLWDTGSLAKIRTLPGGPGSVNSVSFSRSGRLLAAGGQDGLVRLWNTQTYTAEQSTVVGVTPAGPVNAVAFSPAAENLVAVATATDSGNAGISFWNITSGTQEQFSSVGLVRSLAFSPDGTRLATGSDNGTVAVWDAASHDVAAAESSYGEPVRAVAFSPDGRTLATGSDDGSVRLWDASYDAVALSLLAPPLTGPTDSVVGVAFSSDGRMLVSAGSDSTVGLWTVSGPPDRDLPEVRDAAVYASDESLVTAGRSQTPLRWRLEPDSFAPVLAARLPGVEPPSAGQGQAFSMAASADGTLVVVPAVDGPPLVWDLEAGSASRLPVESTGRARVAFAADGDMLVSTVGPDNRRIEVWNARTLHGGPFSVVQTSDVNAVAISPESAGRDATVAVGREDGVVVVYDLLGNRQDVLQNEGNPVETLAYRGDGKMLAVGSKTGVVQLWSDDDGQLVRTLDPLKAPTASALPIVATSFSPDGRLLASVSADGVVRLWDAGNGQLVTTLTGRPGTTSAAYSRLPDAPLLATSDQDGTPVLWDLDPHRVRNRVCGGGPLLSVKEWSTNVPGEPYRRLC